MRSAGIGFRSKGKINGHAAISKIQRDTLFRFPEARASYGDFVITRGEAMKTGRGSTLSRGDGVVFCEIGSDVDGSLRFNDVSMGIADIDLQVEHRIWPQPNGGDGSGAGDNPLGQERH